MGKDVCIRSKNKVVSGIPNRVWFANKERTSGSRAIHKKQIKMFPASNNQLSSASDMVITPILSACVYT